MDVSLEDGATQYSLIISKRKKMWEKLFSKCKNVGENSEEIAIDDLGRIIPTGISPEVTRKSNEDLSVPDEYPADDLDTISDPNNEDFDDISEAESEDIAKFSDSEDEDVPTLPQHVKHIITTYETDSDDDLSEDLDATNEEDEKDFIDDYVDNMRHSRVRYVEHELASSDCSDDEGSVENQNIQYLNEMGNSRIELKNNENVDDADDCSEDENPSMQRKRRFSETEMADDNIEVPPNKKNNSQFKNVKVYINTNETDFENDND